MKLNKKLMVLAAVAALGAASATSALAFENEFHGFYSLKYFLSNYEQGSNGNPLATNSSTHLSPYPTSNTTNNLRLNNYFEQRARIFYNAKASDDLKLVTAFEIDSVFGDRAQGSISTAAATNTTNVAAFRNSGGALESDAVNLETKWVYLDFKIPTTPVQVKAGIQPFKDSIKGIFADFDAAGILTTTKIGAATVNLG